MTTRWLRRSVVAVAILLICVAIVAVPAVHTPILRGAGRLLVVDEAVQPADIIVLTVDAGGAGVLEAADLVHRGISTRVAVFADPPNDVDREFSRRDIAYEDDAAQSIRLLKSLGVTDVEAIPMAVDGTDDEVAVLPVWSAQHQYRSVIVVGTSDHSRRLRRMLGRAMEGHPTKVTVRYSRYSQFDPDRWWQTRSGVRTGIVELEKLLFDIVRHPFS